MRSTMQRLTFMLPGLLLAALLTALPLLLALPGCTDAGKCVRGETDCACKTNGSCESGNTCNEERMCIARSGPPPEEDSGTPPPPPPIDTDCVDDDSATACEAFCEVFCTMQERMCTSSRCEVESCVSNLCDGVCPDADPGCLQSRCEIIKGTDDCKDFGGPDPETDVFTSFCLEQDPTCTPDPEHGCSDVCGSNPNQTGGDFAENGICQDGATGSTGTKRCERSTDCTDCGPRTCAGMDEACSVNGDCCGFPNDAFCIEGRQVCYATCSDDKPCMSPDTCTPLAGSDDSVCVPPG